MKRVEGIEYFELRMSPLLKRRLVEHAAEGKAVLNHLICRCLAECVGLDPDLGLPPKGIPGRPPKKPGIRRNRGSQGREQP
jgi:hypothetical protein